MSVGASSNWYKCYHDSICSLCVFQGSHINPVLQHEDISHLLKDMFCRDVLKCTKTVQKCIFTHRWLSLKVCFGSMILIFMFLHHSHHSFDLWTGLLEAMCYDPRDSNIIIAMINTGHWKYVLFLYTTYSIFTAYSILLISVSILIISFGQWRYILK